MSSLKLTLAQTLGNKLVDSGLWLFWFPFRRIMQMLPMDISLGIGWLAGVVFSWILFPLQKEIADELRELFSKEKFSKESSGKKESSQEKKSTKKSRQKISVIARKSIQLDIQRRVEELILPCLNKESIARLVTIEGEEYLKQAAAQQQGTIILLSHFGSFLTILPALGFKGYLVNQLGGTPTLKHHRGIHEQVFQVKKKDYARLPVRFLRADLHIKKLLQALRKNELVAIAFDGRVGRSWTEVNFFNRPAYFAPGPVRIAAKTGAVLLPTFIVRDRYNHHRLIFEAPVQIIKKSMQITKKSMQSEKGEDFLTENMQGLADLFAGKIAEHPEHFAMIMHINKKRAARGIIEQDIFNR